MADCFFHFNKTGNEQFFSKHLSVGLSNTLISNGNFELSTSGSVNQIFQIHSSRFHFYLIGNCSFYKGFNEEVKLFISDDIEINKILSLFKKINGLCCLFVFDYLKSEIVVITDPLGFYPLYFYEDNEQLVFSSEIKYFTKLYNAKLTLDHHAIFSYLYNGHIIQNRSWYNEVGRTRPASCYTIQIQDKAVDKIYYWSWSSVCKQPGTKAELIKSYSELLYQSIDHLELPENASLGISLSGGLDSRWIAEHASARWNLKPFCFSSSDKGELVLANQVCKNLGLSCTQYKIQAQNWLLDRIDSFWKTDGMLHLGHWHEGLIPQNEYSNFTHCFHGFFGAGIYAGKQDCNKKISSNSAKSHFKFSTPDTGIEDPFYQMDCIDPYIIDQKIRYQSSYSIYRLAFFTRMIIPFYNMDWLQFNYSIDDHMQLNHKFYLEVLNQNLDPKLLNIPWQKTGLSPQHIKMNTWFLKYKIPQLKEATYQCLNSSRHFINYALFDKEINYWINKFSSDIANLQYNYHLKSREHKLRMLSLIIYLKMLSKNSKDVL